MRMGREEFTKWEHKAITLLGMSGVGKTTLAQKLPRTCWFHYSGDYRIGTKYLHEPIMDFVKRQAMQVRCLRELLCDDSIYIASNITIHNLGLISTFLGKVGNPRAGGLSLAEFKQRQRWYREAEIAAMRDVPAFLAKSREIYGYPHFINDAGGSLCELDDEETLERLAEKTLVVYLRADEEMERELTTRALASPKPLYYQEEFFDRKLAEYLALERYDTEARMDPDQFVRWIFPELAAHRRPLYQSIADRHGYTVEAREIERVRGESDFLTLLADSLGAAEAAA